MFTRKACSPLSALHSFCRDRGRPAETRKPITDADIAAWDIAIMPDAPDCPRQRNGCARRCHLCAEVRRLSCEGGKGGGAPGAGPLAGRAR